MVTLQTRVKVGADGAIVLHAPQQFRGRDVEIAYVLSRIDIREPDATAPAWPEGFFEQTYGCADGTGLERPEQPAIDVREMHE